MEKARASEDQTQSLQKYLKEDIRAYCAATFLDRSDAFRRRREERENVVDTHNRLELENRERMRKHLALTREEDARIAKILEDEETEQEKEARILAYLRKENPVLRELQAKLLMAQVNKERFQQMQEKQLLELEKTQKDAVYHQLMEEELARSDRIEQEKAEKLFADKAIVKEILDLQLEEKEMEKRRELALKDKERERIAMVVEKEEEQDNVAAKIKRGRVARLRLFIQEFLKEKAELDKEKAERSKEQEEEILKYQRQVEQRVAEQEEKARLKKKLAELAYTQISAGMEDAQHEKEEMENTLTELYFQELEEAYFKKAAELRIQKEHVKANLRAASEFHEAWKEQRHQQENVQKEMFHKEMMVRLAEVDKEMEERKKQELALMAEAAMIEGERRRLLSETASKLAEFLPKGVIKSQEDLRLVGLAI